MAANAPIEIPDDLVVNGHLRVQNGIYQMVFSWRGGGLEKGSKQTSTGLSEKGNNKRRAERMLDKEKAALIITLEKAALDKGDAKKKQVRSKGEIITTKKVSPDMLFSDYLLVWHQRSRATIEENTWGSYGSNLRIIAPYFAEEEITLDELTEEDLEDFYNYQLQLGKSKNTVHKYHVLIHKALKELFVKHKIDYNPADLAKRPLPDKYIGKFYTIPQLQELAGSLDGHKLEFAVYCAGYYGLRRSETVGLKWENFDLENNLFVIRHTVISAYIDGHYKTYSKDHTKNKSSTRSLPIVPPFREMLLRMKARQEEYRELCGNCYNNRFLDYIYVDPMGNLVKPGYITQAFKNYVVKNGPKVIRYHDLRHTCASILYANGVDLKQIQLWLGHSTIQTTANIYSHFIQDPFDAPKAVLVDSWAHK